AMCNQVSALVIAIQDRRGVRMYVLLSGPGDPRLVPDLVARLRIEANDTGFDCRVSSIAVDELKVEPAVVEKRRTRHAELNVQRPLAIAHVEFPLLFAVERVAAQDAGRDHCPDVLAVGHGRIRCGIALVATHDTIPG